MRWYLDLLDAAVQHGDSSTELLALRVAEWALGIAVLTLTAVFAQIWIANRQLKLAREELDAVKLDLANSSALIALTQRRAKLHLTLGDLGIRPESNGETRVHVVVHNTGDRMIEKVKVKLLRPPAATTHVRVEGAVSEPTNPGDEKLRPHYNRIEVILSAPVYRFDPYDLTFFFDKLEHPVEGHPFGWRVVHEDGETPSLTTYAVLSENWEPPADGSQHTTPEILTPDWETRTRPLATPPPSG